MCQALCGRDARAPGGASSTQKTGNMVYIMPRNRARRLVQASRITPPLRGSRRDQGGAHSRAGGGQTPRLVSEFQRCVGGPYAASFLKRCAFPKGASNSPPTRLPGDRIFYDNSAREVGLRVERRQSFLMLGIKGAVFCFDSLRSTLSVIFLESPLDPTLDSGQAFR